MHRLASEARSSQTMRPSEAEPLDGYQVLSVDGDRVGTVAGVSKESIVVERGRWRRTYRAVPMTLAAVRHIDRSVIVLVQPDVLARSPKIKPDRAVDDDLIAAHYEASTIATETLAVAPDKERETEHEGI
jgi:hypothetical protein